MSHVNTAWNIPLCQMPGGIKTTHLQPIDANLVQCGNCKNRHFAILNKQDFYISMDKSIYTFPAVKYTTTAEDQVDAKLKPAYVVIDDQGNNIGIEAEDYDIFIQRYLDWRVNK